MQATRLLLLCAFAVGVGGTAWAAVTSSTTHGELAHDLDGMISSTDILQGLVPTELPGDLGWHSVNPAASNSLHPWGLPAFTDGMGTQGNFYGLLNDNFPPAVRGEPVKLLEYDLGGTFDIERIHLLTGNATNADGRIFSTSVIRYSTNGGASFDQLGYFQSDPSGSVNDETGIPDGRTENMATLVEIFDDSAQVMVSGVTHLQIDLYAVDNTEGQMRDPFDGINPFTGIDDGLTAGFVSPLVWEIDVLGQAGVSANADFDDDGNVDGDDFLVWQRGMGLVGTANLADGDANGDQSVNGADLAVWSGQFGSTGLVAAVPEPPTFSGLFSAILIASRVRRRRLARH